MEFNNLSEPKDANDEKDVEILTSIESILRPVSASYGKEERPDFKEKEILPPTSTKRSNYKAFAVPLWVSSPKKKQKIVRKRTATLFTGKSIPIGWDSFGKIVKEDCTFLDKMSLISEFLNCDLKVSIIV
ncbi:hypothetical protein C1645_812983 [Glomus cerebriforme]|uniref:Uncharacterized protein n=1 Tax=Glomus cerebriforme TaxID=658196 RepID=A0A397TJ64_9GLOM|nr:hypothetical protein C1645_812983 [Glomus cerebriforme]